MIYTLQDLILFFKCLFIMIIIVVGMYYLRIKKPICHRELSHSQLIHKVNTFDIIFFSHPRLSSKVWSFLQGFYYPHIGMIYKDTIDQKVYVWEADNHDRFGKTGVDIIPIEDILQRYKNSQICIVKLNWKNTNDYQKAYQKLQHFINKTKYSPFEISFWNAVFSHYKIMYSKNTIGYSCSELIVDTLNYCNVIEINYPKHMITPKNIYYQEYMELNKDSISNYHLYHYKIKE